MKAVVLAAGEGRRLRPLTETRPKPMLPMANRPMLEYVVEAVRDAGVEEIVLVVGYQRDRIQSHFGDGDDLGVDIEYAIQEKQLGTGHAILQAEPRIDEEFVVLNGDRLIRSTAVEGLLEADRDGGAVITVTRSADPSRYGVVELDGDRVARLTEKPLRHLSVSEIINAGVYRFGPEVFDAIRETPTGPSGEQAVTDTLERWIEGAPPVRAVRYTGPWLDVSQLWDIVSVNGDVLDRGHGGITPGATVHERGFVADGVAVGEDAWIGPNATVLGGTSVGPNVIIDPGAVISNAVIMPDVTVEAGAVIRDCVLGESVRVRPNVTIEGGYTDVTIEGELYEQVKLGGVVGDNARIGGNTTVMPGTIIGKGSVVEGGSTVSGHIASGTEVRRG